MIDSAMLLRTHGLAVGYRGASAIQVEDFSISRGSVLHVCGPNGSGKTALLKTLAGLLPPCAGRIERRSCAPGTGGAVYVHSVPYLFAGTVRTNLALSRPPEERLASSARIFGLDGLLDRAATTLSHGEQRRVALARAIAAMPELLLVDEPEGGLDDDALAQVRGANSRALFLGEGSTRGEEVHSAGAHG